MRRVEFMSNQPSPVDPEGELERSLLNAEQALSELKARYSQVKQGQSQQEELQQRLSQLQQEVKQIQRQLNSLEIELESRLFSWVRLSDPFWQAVRFGGIGLVGGWFLHWLIRR
ncbi:MAG: hypothetical protein F6K32_09895 [Desertifilum sp. SIO1I2]|nr:hypothetical protein [Desertifilum sp. SIO1I2]